MSLSCKKTKKHLFDQTFQTKIWPWGSTVFVYFCSFLLVTLSAFLKKYRDSTSKSLLDHFYLHFLGPSRFIKMVRPDGTRKISCSIDGANPADITDLTQQAKQHKDDGTVGVCLFKLIT